MFFTCFHHLEEVANMAHQNMKILIKSDENLAKAFTFYFEDYIKKMEPYMN